MSNNQYLAELLITQLLPARLKLYTSMFPKIIFVNNCEGSMAEQVNAHKVQKVIKSRLLRKLSLKCNICFTFRSGYILYSAQRVGFFSIGSGRVLDKIPGSGSGSGRVRVSKNTIGYFRVSFFSFGYFRVFRVFPGMSGIFGFFWVYPYI